jgi:flagellin-like protein
MKMTARKAVDPIIATLLLIAIAVAAGIIVYVYVNSLAGGLTQGGGQQVSDQMSMDAYNYATIASGPTITIRDTGSSSVSITGIFFDGTSVTTLGSVGASSTCTSTQTTTPFATCSTGQTLTFTITSNGATSEASGTSHAVKVLDSTGGTEVITVVAGRTG